MVADTPFVLSKQLRALNMYCEHENLKLNDKKSKIVVFKKTPLIKPNYTFFEVDNYTLEVVNEDFYLGIDLNS